MASRGRKHRASEFPAPIPACAKLVHRLWPRFPPQTTAILWPDADAVVHRWDWGGARRCLR
eukprot:scaffold9812_cov56-Phaeocystis_antarctica.AAC.5